MLDNETFESLKKMLIKIVEQITKLFNNSHNSYR